MLKKLYANAVYKKTTIFVAVFVIASILVSDWYTTGEALLGTAVNAITAGMARFPITKIEDKHSSQDVLSQPIQQTQETAEFVFSGSIPMSYELQKYTYEKCLENNLDYEMVLALIWRESRFEPDALGYNTNGTVDSGIMQINEVNHEWIHREYGLDNMMDPKQNIAAGTAILGSYKAKYGDEGALYAYQYGETGYLNKASNGELSAETIAALQDKQTQYEKLLQDQAQ